MKKLSVFITIIAAMMLAQTALAQSDKELTIKAARLIETAPFDKETVKMSKKAEQWVTETKDVTVGLCGGVVGQFGDKKYKIVAIRENEVTVEAIQTTARTTIRFNATNALR